MKPNENPPQGGSALEGISAQDQAVMAWLAGEDPVPEPAPAPGTPLPVPAEPRRGRRWPLLLIASPAAVAIWSGWVALGALCGFGYVHPLPGIIPGFSLDTAITLPVGVEAYGAYALGAWLSPGTPPAARRFARWSAIGSLVLGMAGQVAYHLLAAAHQARAPWPVVVAVSCVPVVTLGFAAALTHLRHAEAPAPSASPCAVPGVPQEVPEPDEHSATAAAMFAADLLAGRVPGIRAIKSGLSVGQDRAREVRGYLRELAAASGGSHE